MSGEATKKLQLLLDGVFLSREQVLLRLKSIAHLFSSLYYVISYHGNYL